MSDKRKATFWDRVWLAVYGWAWVACWFAAIWIEQFRGQLFWTGTLALFRGITVACSVDTSRNQNEAP